MYFLRFFHPVFLHSDLKMTLHLIWCRSTDLGFEISDPKNLCLYFSEFFYGIFCSLTFKWPWIWHDGGQWTSDSKSMTTKTYICIFYWVFLPKTLHKSGEVFIFCKWCSGLIGGMRVVRLGLNWFFIVSRYCRNFFEFFGRNLNRVKTGLKDPPPLLIKLFFCVSNFVCGK